MERYLASIFVKDILDLYNLNPTASEYEELGFNIKRDVFYYIINGDTKYINDTKAEALKKLILKKTNSENKNILFSYLKSHIGNIDAIIDKNDDKNSLEKVIDYAIDQFKFKDNDKEIKEFNINKIAEYYLKSLNFLNKDLDIAFLIIEEMIEEILNTILIKENLKFINHNRNIIKILNTLNYKKIIPVYIKNIILFIIDNIPNCNCISSKKIIHGNLKYILKWFYEDYLNISFDKLEEKTENQFFRNQLLRTYSLKELIKKGWSIELFAKTMLNLFKNTIEDLSEDNTSSLEEMITIIKKQRESRKILFKGEKPIGCWSLSPLYDVDFKRDCEGEFFVSEFNDISMPIFISGTYNIHFGVICLEETYRDIQTFNKLFFSLIKFIEYMSLKGIYIDKICTQTYSDYGKSLAEGIGLKYITKHQDGKGDVYVGDMKTLLKRPFLRDYALLKNAYGKYF